MSERPILFSGPMVRAVLAGTKTQTRRVVKGMALEWLQPGMFTPDFVADPGNALCPYGQPGDRLWVRESWMPDPPIDDTWASTQWAGCREGKIAGVPERFRHPHFCNYAADWLHGPVRWTPSIHMPRWASRILLEVTEVRVERLQDICADDAWDEGTATWAAENPPRAPNGTVDKFNNILLAYAALWESINGAGSWDANPWVWAVTFFRSPLAPGVKGD